MVGVGAWKWMYHMGKKLKEKFKIGPKSQKVGNSWSNLVLFIFRPPCIPYVGLVLQDLTFVHIGNPDTFDNKVNFAKRWQQFNILVNIYASHAA